MLSEHPVSKHCRAGEWTAGDFPLAKYNHRGDADGGREREREGGADLFLDYYAAKSKLLRYSSGLFAPKDRFILFSLYQCR